MLTYTLADGHWIRRASWLATILKGGSKGELAGQQSSRHEHLDNLDGYHDGWVGKTMQVSARITTIDGMTRGLAVRFLEGFVRWSFGSAIWGLGEFGLWVSSRGAVVHHGNMVSRRIGCPMELCSYKNRENCSE